VLTAAELGEYIDSRLTRSAFRLELLDRYDVESDGDDVARYLRGEPEPSPERKEPWLDRLRREREAGILNHRVHVLRTPLSDYLRYECEWGHARNAAVEDIRIVDLAERDAPDGLPGHDFWLIDDLHVIRMHYDEAGRYLGAEPVDDSQLSQYQLARDSAVAAGEPFVDWWSRHPEEWQAHHLE
jgi:hypothetical protein